MPLGIGFMGDIGTFILEPSTTLWSQMPLGIGFMGDQ